MANGDLHGHETFTDNGDMVAMDMFAPTAGDPPIGTIYAKSPFPGGVLKSFSAFEPPVPAQAYGHNPFPGGQPSAFAPFSDVVIPSPGFDQADVDSTILVLSDGKTLEKISGTTVKSGQSKTGNSSGKKYAEFSIYIKGSGVYVGIAKSSVSKAGNFTDSIDGYGYYSEDGNKRNNGVSTPYGVAYGAGDVVNLALDSGAGKVWFGRNGIWQNSGNPETGVNEAYSGLSGSFHVYIAFISTGTKGKGRFVDGEYRSVKPNQYSQWEGPFVNQPPTVDAGPDDSVAFPGPYALDGTVTDDGLPNPVVTTTWTQLSGPGTATFGDASAVDTTVTVDQQGAYRLQLEAYDGEYTVNDDVRITFTQAQGNNPPFVDAGPDQLIALSETAQLDGTVTDDGQPPQGTLTTLWTKFSGPGNVIFGDDTAVDTTASFDLDGVYVLQLQADDSALQTTDTVTITVNPAVPAPPSGGGQFRKAEFSAGTFTKADFNKAGFS